MSGVPCRRSTPESIGTGSRKNNQTAKPGPLPSVMWSGANSAHSAATGRGRRARPGCVREIDADASRLAGFAFLSSLPAIHPHQAASRRPSGARQDLDRGIATTETRLRSGPSPAPPAHAPCPARTAHRLTAVMPWASRPTLLIEPVDDANVAHGPVRKDDSVNQHASLYSTSHALPRVAGFHFVHEDRPLDVQRAASHGVWSEVGRRRRLLAPTRDRAR